MKLPTDAIIAVTYKCNSKCVMCDIWKKPVCEEIDVHSYTKLPSSLKYINVSGGEPFLRKNLPEVITVLNETCNNPRIGISTNGLFTDRIKEHMETILSNGIKDVSVNVSVHGIGEFHDRVEGIKDAFNKAINTVHILKEIGVKDLGIAFTATNHNINQLSKVIELAKELDIQYTFAGIAHRSELMFGMNNEPIADMEELGDQLEKLTKDHLKSFYPKDWFRAYIDSGNYYYAKTGKRKIKCGAGTDFFFMTPNGDIHPDNVLNWNFGNITNQTFNEIWGSKEADKFRNTININNCPNPCWMLCTVFPHMRHNALSVIEWVLTNKFKVNAGMNFTPVQYEK